MTIDYSDFIAAVLAEPLLASWGKTLPRDIVAGLSTGRYGDLPTWLEILAALPPIEPSQVSLKHKVAVGDAVTLSASERDKVRRLLLQLAPWRKGPFTIHDIDIDSEWRSDWKWSRLAARISPLQSKRVLDVGCGNGYYAWRMRGAGAARVIGIDPSPRFVVQFYALKHFMGMAEPVDVLPLGIEQLPANLQAFDTTFSMGVLYHRRSPMDHLKELLATLKPGGELILETLVIDGELGHTLVPEDRYAMMNNVWFIPSCRTLLSWLGKCGFEGARLVDVSQTTMEEQRRTEWMTYHSLKDFLDPKNPNLTVEGHPAPKRAIFIAHKP